MEGRFARPVVTVGASGIGDATATEQAIQTLTGREVAPRFEFIMERAPKVEEVDV